MTPISTSASRASHRHAHHHSMGLSVVLGAPQALRLFNLQHFARVPDAPLYCFRGRPRRRRSLPAPWAHARTSWVSQRGPRSPGRCRAGGSWSGCRYSLFRTVCGDGPRRPARPAMSSMKRCWHTSGTCWTVTASNGVAIKDLRSLARF